MAVERYIETVSEQIARMRVETGVQTDAELARALQIDPSAVSNWRRRGAVPQKYQLRFHRVRNEYMHEGALSPSHLKLSEAYVFSLIIHLGDNLRQTAGLGVDQDQEMIWIGFQARRAFNFFEAEFRKVDINDKDALRKKYEYYENFLSTESAYPWVETLPDR